MTPEELAEIKDAVAARLQPECPICGAPLIIWQPNSQVVEWSWNEVQRRFDGQPCGEGWSDEPYCAHCENADWDFRELFELHLLEASAPGDGA